MLLLLQLFEREPLSQIHALSLQIPELASVFASLLEVLQPKILLLLQEAMDHDWSRTSKANLTDYISGTQVLQALIQFREFEDTLTQRRTNNPQWS